MNATLSIYMEDMARYPLLTAVQELDFAERYEQGRDAQSRLDSLDPARSAERKRLQGIVQQGHEARQSLIQHNLRLVISMAKRYRGMGLTLDDLIQEGNVGLIKAVERYDHRKGVRFATYAGYWIKQTIRRALTNKSRAVRVPAHVTARLRRLRRSRKELESDLHRPPTAQELAEHTGFSVAQVRRLTRLQQRKILSLDMPIGDDDSSELGDLVPDQKAVPVEEAYAERRLRQDVREIVVERLSAREQKVLRMRYGLDSRQSQTLKQVAKQLGITRERVRQIEKRALRRLRYAQSRHELGSRWARS